VLNEFQTKLVWENMLAAETRSFYFGDLAARYNRQKQWITGLSFFFSSGAAASIIGKSPQWLPTILALAVAAATAYSIALNLDGKVRTMSKLHSSWSAIGTDYNRLWNHTYADEAEEDLYDLIEKAKESSELATTSAPNDQKLLEKWQEHVFSMYHLTGQHG
jgi:hypothetical protein